MSLVQIILVVIVAFIIGCSSVNDQIETYQPVVACSLIGLGYWSSRTRRNVGW